MLNNKSFAPGLLAGSKEYSYHATKVAKELLMYVEFTGHQYVSPEYVLMRSHYCHYLLMHVISGHIVYETDGCSGEAGPARQSSWKHRSPMFTALSEIPRFPGYILTELIFTT